MIFLNRDAQSTRNLYLVEIVLKILPQTSAHSINIQAIKAIKALKEKTGSSVPAIVKYIKETEKARCTKTTTQAALNSV